MKAAAFLLLAASMLAVPAVAQDAGVPGRKKPEFTMTGAVNNPTRLPADPAGLKLPAGYAVSVAATDLGNARMVAVAQDGTVYITRRTEADMLMLRDMDRDGRYEVRRVVAARPNLHGLAIDGRTIYLLSDHKLFRAPLMADGSLGEIVTLVDDLPDAGQHMNRTMAVGPDGKLYVSVGSTCNECDEPNRENATLLVMNREGKQRRIFASGLRNTIGFDWSPATGQLWGLDQGVDWLGDDEQPEELNRIGDGKRYGWPYIFAAGFRNPHRQPPGGVTLEEWDRTSERPVTGYTAHAAAMQLKFAGGSGFPQDAQADAFATFRGSWNRAEPSGYEVVRIRFDERGNPTKMEPFMTGFLTTAPGGEAGWTGRPTGLAFAPDGSMLVTDSENGVLYRVRYSGAGGTRPAAAGYHLPPPAPPADVIAMDRPETQAQAKLSVTSSAFAPQAAIPMRFSGWHDNVSPPLAWGAGPAGTRAWAIIVDDPDAATKPTTHWVAWNIPAAATSLAEGVPGRPRLEDGMRQGSATNGATGWTGPHPPVGDRPHSYHFQLFALDQPLALEAGADRKALLAAMQGHVVAKGELIGRYGQPQPPAKLN